MHNGSPKVLNEFKSEQISGGSRGAPALPQWDPILLFLHTFLLKSTRIGH